MLGLGDYESSGDEDTTDAQKSLKRLGGSADKGSNNVSCAILNRVLQKAYVLILYGFSKDTYSSSASIGRDYDNHEDKLQKTSNATANLSTSDTFIGPTMAVEATAEQSGQAESQSPPLSPYSAQRAAIRRLTLPPIPNFDIPPSPPGSPSQATTAKFERFLELKAQGIHFNEKLEKSSALRNPALFRKLMDYAGISEEDQYCSTLPDEMAVPTKFPDWASPEELAKAQQQATLRREEEIANGQRTSVEFVPPSTSGKVSVAERVMAGLDRGGPSTRMKSSDSGERKNRDGRDSSLFKVAHR